MVHPPDTFTAPSSLPFNAALILSEGHAFKVIFEKSYSRLLPLGKKIGRSGKCKKIKKKKKEK